MSSADGRRSRTLEAAGCRFTFSLRGAGISVLFLHGLSANRSVWDPVLDRLPRGLLAIVPDLPGRGDSRAPPQSRFRLAEEATRLEAFLDRLGVRRPLVVGHSHGAALAVALAARGRSAGLLLTAPVSPYVRRPPGLSLLRWRPVVLVGARIARLFRRPLTRYILERRVYANPNRVDPERVERYAAPFANVRQAECLLRALADWRPRELEALSVPREIPVIVLAAETDRRIGVTGAREWAARLHGAFEVVPATGHVVPEEAPDIVADRVERLARAAAAQGGAAGEHQE